MGQQKTYDLGYKETSATLQSAENGDVVDLSLAEFLGIDPIATVRRSANKPNDARSPTVSIAIADGKSYIVSGIRRRQYWSDNPSKAPSALHAAVHHCENFDSAYRLYRRYERSAFDDDSVAQIMLGYADNKLELTSTRLKDGRIANALYLVFRGQYPSDDDKRAPLNLREAVGYVCDELEFLDRLGCPSRIFYSGVLAAAIIGLGLDGKSKNFVERVATKRGNKRDGLMDPVECVQFLVTLTDMMDRSGTLNYQPELFRRCLRALEAWWSVTPIIALNEEPSANPSFWFKGKLREQDPGPIISRFRTAKSITHRRDL